MALEKALALIAGRATTAASGLVLALVLAVAGCGGGDDDAQTAAAPFPPTTVSATGKIAAPSGPETEDSPAPPSVPTAPFADAAEPLFRLERVGPSFVEPVYVAMPASGPKTLYVVERAGRILALDSENRVTPFLDIRNRVRTEIEEGLHSVAFHPGFAENGRFFVVHNDKRGDVRIVEYQAEGKRADPASAREIFAIDKTEGVKWHNGGQLQFGPDGRLYFAMGDSARNQFDQLPNPVRTPDPDNNAQNLTLPFGKLFRINVDQRTPRVEVVALGLRNTWRFSFDRENGDLYLADVGQFGWEELDYLPAGTDGLINFGWSLFEANDVHNRGFPLSRGRLVWPVLRYEHGPGLYCSIRGSITGGYVYRGEEIPALAGRYVFGDFCSGEMWTARVVNGAAVEIRKEPTTVPSLVSFGEDADGELYAISFFGDVHRLVTAG